jgi:putative ABC transport system permease protein
MSVLVAGPAVTPGAVSRRPARRAMTRWAWRLFRREWRRQALVLALLVVAVAATTVGLGVASNALAMKADPVFGTANTEISLPGGDAHLAADLAAIRARFGTADVVAHQELPVPGSVSALDVRAEDPRGPFVHVTVRLDAGRYPAAATEVAVTKGAAGVFGLHVGSAWVLNGHAVRVVGEVENPLDLLDQFVLVPPGAANPPSSVSVLVDASRGSIGSFAVPGGMAVNGRGDGARAAGEALVLALGTLGMLFVGLMAVAGFSVMAQRRQRSLGLLGAMGATDRHLRTALVADGAAVGATGAVTGMAVGLVAWLALVPALRSITSHRIDPLALPWWALALTMALALLTSVAASWWPARAVARMSVVGALSGRAPRPRPAHRSAALGVALLALGIVLLAFANPSSNAHRPAFIIVGTLVTPIGVLLLAPAAVRGLGPAARRAPVAVKLALRDLSRYQARSGAALSAVALAIGVAATIGIAANATQKPATVGNLSTRQLMLYLTPDGPGSQVPPLAAAQLQAVTARVNALAATIHAATVPVEEAYHPGIPAQAPFNGPRGREPTGYATPTLAHVQVFADGESVTAPTTLYVATPALLAHFGIDPARISPSADVVTARHDLGGEEVFDPMAAGAPGPRRTPGSDATQPVVQDVPGLPLYTSAPGTLLTAHGMAVLGVQPLPAGWLVEAAHPLTTSEIATARNLAAATGLYVETRTAKKSSAPLRNWSTAAGGLIALGVLGMTVGLIRSETAPDLRVLTAAGASGGARRALTSVTAGSLALLGAALGTAGAYAALVAWYRHDLRPLGHVPVGNLLVLVVGFPFVAAAAGWLLAGREPQGITRQPAE